jgi:hypothetical protein
MDSYLQERSFPYSAPPDPADLAAAEHGAAAACAIPRPLQIDASDATDGVLFHAQWFVAMKQMFRRRSIWLCKPLIKKVHSRIMARFPIPVQCPNSSLVMYS